MRKTAFVTRTGLFQFNVIMESLLPGLQYETWERLYQSDAPFLPCLDMTYHLFSKQRCQSLWYWSYPLTEAWRQGTCGCVLWTGLFSWEINFMNSKSKPHTSGLIFGWEIFYYSPTIHTFVPCYIRQRFLCQSLGYNGHNDVTTHQSTIVIQITSLLHRIDVWKSRKIGIIHIFSFLKCTNSKPRN